MSVTIKRNTGWLGMASRIKIKVNGEKVGSIQENGQVEIELPDEKVQLKVTQLFAAKSNEITVKDGDIIRIRSAGWYRRGFPTIMIAIFLPNLFPGSTYSFALSFIIFAMLIISPFLFNAFHLVKE